MGSGRVGGARSAWWLMVEPRFCQGCGVTLPPSRAPGRPRKWCSGTCRRHALYSGVCVDCGGATYNGTVPPPERCRACNGTVGGQRNKGEWAPYRAMVEEMWAEGMTGRQIGEALGWSKYGCVTNIAMLRARGYDLPYRRTPEQRARIAAASVGHLAKARAARKVAA